MLDGKKMWSVAAGWFDYNNDGLLDLFVVELLQMGGQQGSRPARSKHGMRAYCHPKQLRCRCHNTLYRNNGDGTFTDVSDETGIASHFGKGMGVVFADYDGDGFMDVFVANDTTPELPLPQPRRQEIRGGRRCRRAWPITRIGNALSGMGADFRDVDNDGLPDIWHTAVEHETFPLFINRGGGRLRRCHRPPAAWASDHAQMSGWGNGIVDFDNDGWKDLFVARGNVLDNIQHAIRRAAYPEPNSVFRNLGNGKFEDVSAHGRRQTSRSPAPHRGVAFGDLDNDGRIDAVVTVPERAGEASSTTSRSNGNHWMLLKLVGTKSNRMGLGAQVRITTPTAVSSGTT